jgi:hypothetical protein
VIFRPRNPAEHCPRREFFIIESKPFHQRLHYRLLIGFVVNHKILCMPNRRLARHRRGNSQSFNVPPQHAHAKRMESRDHRLGNTQPTDKFFHALTHLGGGLVGEGHGENGLRHRALVLDEIRNAVGNYASLPAPRARQDQHRSFGSFHSLALLRI